MSISRRSFVRRAAAGAAGAFASSLISARGREDAEWSLDLPAASADQRMLILSSNENPIGPAPRVVRAVKEAMGPTGLGAARYPIVAGDLKNLVATPLGAKAENVLATCGSVQGLRLATEAFTSKTRHLVTPVPTYEACANYADVLGNAVKRVPLDSRLAMDLDAMLAAAKGAGLVYVCNPNNPTGVVHPGKEIADFITRVLQASPDTTVLVDEAYHEYVVDPSYQSQIALAVQNPRVIVARTFSKVYGMAGLRCGYAVAHADTIKKLADWDNFTIAGRLNVLALRGAIAALELEASYLKRESARNREALDFTRAFFHKAGFKDTETQSNCVFVDIRKPSEAFTAACREQGVLVGRPFPPLTNYTRITVGTMEEMRRAVPVFQKALGLPAA